jgi:hypothetical protein
MSLVIEFNEVNGSAATAYTLTAPHPNQAGNGNSGWTLGYFQEDFHGDPTDAQQLLSENGIEERAPR